MVPEARPAVLVFAKAPEPGQVKTRLAASIGPGPAAVLAARLALRAVATACDAGVGPVQVWCAPDRTHPFFDVCRRRHGVALHDQVGPDLGVRMGHALAFALRQHAAAILVGTDVPSMTADDLRLAAAALASGDDAVFGPAEDGGYWLIGVRRMADRVFEGMAWGTGTVLEDTRRRCDDLGWKVSAVATRWDVDRPEDLERLRGDPQAAGLAAQLPRAA